MLKTIVYSCIMAFCLSACGERAKQQEASASAPAEATPDSTATARIEFTEKSFNFGDLVEGESVAHTFHFKNTGNKALVITNVEASCGCTEIEYDKKPIPPGGEGKLEVVFDSKGRMGKQYKIITIFANVPKKNVELKVIANIKPQ